MAIIAFANRRGSSRVGPAETVIREDRSGSHRRSSSQAAGIAVSTGRTRARFADPPLRQRATGALSCERSVCPCQQCVVDVRRGLHDSRIPRIDSCASHSDSSACSNPGTARCPMHAKTYRADSGQPLGRARIWSLSKSVCSALPIPGTAALRGSRQPLQGLLSDTERREDPVEDIVHGGSAGNRV